LSAPDLSHADIYGGLDVGRVNDLTVLTPGAEVVGRQDVAVAYLVKTLTAKRTAFRAQRKMIFDAHDLLDFQRLSVDATGLGAQLAEELEEAFGEDVVEKVNFSAEVKADLATRAFRWLRDGRVRFTRDAAGKTLHDECIALRRKVSDAGNIQYVSPRTAAGHGDHFWSMALMLRAMDRGQAPRGLGDSMMGHA
jgi:phage FluMu gp28-like protein